MASEENREDIKSKAVVTYSRQSHPDHYKKLKENFNLNQPLGSWLHSGSKWENYVRGTPSGKQAQFTSFNIAHHFRDMAGEVDVISDAENIKKLLKMPFCNKAQISMMVHRVGSSLLLDDFDIHKHLLRKQQNDWQWLRRFYYDIVAHNMQHKDKWVIKKNKTRDFLQSREMFSKFLYYSSLDNSTPDPEDAELPTFPGRSVSSDLVPDSIHHLLPDHMYEGELPDFQRTVNWTFEDISMLIGTNLPIFGEGTHPCVSLRLRDMEKPINVLTGLDYWLDNLMCNVPELAMCYHIDGIVQKYELLKTEDIPHLEDSMFQPQLVKDIAQNILSFLKSNATKEGHTYWLFKGTDDDVVKLYDLSTLCAGDMQDNQSQNPFTVPVGILLYRVARNMCQTQRCKKSGTIRTLLENCITLLDTQQHSQVITSAHYLLSDLYISSSLEELQPVGAVHQSEAPPPTENKKPQVKKKKGKKQDIERVEKQQDLDQKSRHSDVKQSHLQSTAAVEVAVPTLCIPENVEKPSDELLRYPPVTGDIHERCKDAVTHISKGLLCLDGNAAIFQKHQEERVDCQAQCNPAQAIPLHYSPLQKDQGEIDGPERHKSDYQPDMNDPDSSQVTVWSSSLPYNSWHASSKVLLLLKAVVAYRGLAQAELKEHQYGGALRYATTAVLCFNAIKALKPLKAKENASMLTSLLSLCGDVYLMLAHCTEDQQITAHKHSYRDRTRDEDCTIVLNSASKEINTQDCKWLEEFQVSSEKNYEYSIRCYQEVVDVSSLKTSPSKPSTSCVNKDSPVKVNSLRRLANAINELGVFYMNQAAAGQGNSGQGIPSERVDELCSSSLKHLRDGVKAFQCIGDRINMALLHSNMGRVMRVYASNSVVTRDTGQREFSFKEKQYYAEALEHYHTALGLLEKREYQPQIWDSITWELSTVYFTMATLMQDFAPLSHIPQEQVEKEVTELMTKALKNCDTESESPRLPTCQYRAASIHHRLASLYHNAYRGQMIEQKKKHLRQLAELHYGKAWRYFTEVESACEMLRVLLEQVAMSEFHIAGQTGSSTRIKTLQMGLSHLLDSGPCLRLVENQLQDESTLETWGYQDEADKLMTILVSRLSFFLMNLVKATAQLKKGKLPEEVQSSRLQCLKSMYELVLKYSQDDKQQQQQLSTESQQQTDHAHRQSTAEGVALKPQVITRCHHLSQLIHRLTGFYHDYEQSLKTGAAS